MFPTLDVLRVYQILYPKEEKKESEIRLLRRDLKAPTPPPHKSRIINSALKRGKEGMNVGNDRFVSELIPLFNLS